MGGAVLKTSKPEVPSLSQSGMTPEEYAEHFACLQELEKQHRIASEEVKQASNNLLAAEQALYVARNKVKGMAYALSLAKEVFEGALQDLQGGAPQDNQRKT